MMEVETVAGGAADHLMECEEQLENVSPTPEKHKEKEKVDEGVCGSVSLTNHEGRKSPEPVRIIPIPAPPVITPSTPNKTMKPAGSTLGFTVNGRPIHLLPGGGGAELRLHSHPEGSTSGFTTIQIPVTLTLNSPLGTRYITTTASLTASSSAPPPAVASSPSAPGPEPIPIITGVVSGEAAQKVLNDHSVKLNSASQKLKKAPPSDGTPKPKKSRSKPRPSRIAAPDKLLRKGEIGAATPPDCLICKSQYKLITELRGFMCMCSPAIAEGLRNLKRLRIKRRRRERERRKALKSSREPQMLHKEPQIQTVVSPVKVVTPPRRIQKYSGDIFSDELSSSTSPTLSPQLPEKLLPVDYPPSKLVIMVEDFFYGRAPGSSTDKDSLLEDKFRGVFHCIHCSTVLSNNIKLMDHMQQHASVLSQEDGHVDSMSSCPHCFRHYPSPFSLQCHMRDVHSQNNSAVMCKICELAFDNEPALLCHMKSTHKPGEMPYACQVCEFRSSFYSDALVSLQRGSL
ncbi:uncharacterized protein FYW61_013083 [Anableps anableps]